MKDKNRTKEQLIGELAKMRQRVTKLEASDTGFKQAEQALQAERNKLQSLIDAIEYGLSIQDKEYNIIYQSKPSRMTGCYHLGEKCYQAYEGRDKICDGCPMGKAFKDGKSHTVERKVVTPAGEAIFLENTASPIRDAKGKITSCLEVTREITERKRAEEELRLQRAYFQQLFDNSPDAIACLDISDRFVSINKGFEALFGYRPEEVQGRLINETIVPEDRMDEAAVLSQARFRNEMVRLETVRKRKDGSLVDVSMIGYPIRFGDKNVGSYAIYTDITERKQAEKKLRKLHEQERKERIKLESERRARLQFIDALTHELKTPLLSVIASGGLLLEGLREWGQSPRLRLAENIVNTTRRLESRLSELLAMARLESPSFGLNLELLDIRPLLREVASELAPAAVGKHQVLTLDVPPSISMVKADKKRLGQVLFNLLSNAIKLCGEGGSIQLGLREEEGEVVVEIKDNGPGISGEEKERLLASYYQVEEGEQRYSGVGLGLVRSKQLVELHGGKLWVESEPGKGNMLCFSLAAEPERKGVETSGQSGGLPA